MAFTSIIITASFERADATPAQGSVSATLSEPIVNGSEQIDPAPIVGHLSAAGSLESSAGGPFTLAANNDPATLPAGSSYQFVVELDGVLDRTFSAVVAHDAAAGTVDLAAL